MRASRLPERHPLCGRVSHVAGRLPRRRAFSGTTAGAAPAAKAGEPGRAEPSVDGPPELRVLGQYADSYIIAADAQGLLVGDQLYFYASGRMTRDILVREGVSSTGLGVMRRDGFASMEAQSQEGTLTTRPVQFSGKYLFVNTDAVGGELRAAPGGDR